MKDKAYKNFEAKVAKRLTYAGCDSLTDAEVEAGFATCWTNFKGPNMTKTRAESFDACKTSKCAMAKVRNSKRCFFRQCEKALAEGPKIRAVICDGSAEEDIKKF